MSYFDNPRMLAPALIERTDLDDGAFILANPQPLGEIARCVGEWLDDWARRTPNALFLAERDAAGEWRKLSYGEVRSQIGKIAQSLLDMGLGPEEPVVALSDPGIDQALLMLATLHIGRPFSTVSSAYSRLSRDFGKVRHALRELRPGLVYAVDAAVYKPAIEACSPSCPVLVSQSAETLAGSLRFDGLLRGIESPQVAHAFQSIEPGTHAKYMLTSGSTGHPKIVINTHRMLCANQKQIQLAWPFLKEEKPIIVSWLPWSHTFGTNYNFNMVLANGGSFYFDEGRPMPGLIEKTVQNLREVQPNLLLNVPRGFDSLVSLMEADEAIARDCLGRVRVVFYAGAALTQNCWDRINVQIDKVIGERVLFSSSLGSTETSPVGTYLHWRSDDPRCVGLPVAGMQMKFIPNGDKLEVRMKGPQIFPGYLRDEARTAEAFDEDGYYKIGDAACLIDPARPEKGIAFNGRVAEDFKLATGTWVSVGSLRIKAVSLLAPYAQDVVVTGHDRNEVGLLIFPTPKARQADSRALRAHVCEALEKIKEQNGASLSLTPKRAIFLSEPPCIESGEITDKGYINQRLVLRQRAEIVDRLYAALPADPDVIVLA